MLQSIKYNIMKRQDRFDQALVRLKDLYPNSKCALIHNNPYELLIATILSAQCTDVRINIVTPNLFAKYPSAHELAKAPIDDIREEIKTINFFNNKTKFLKKTGEILVEKYDGQVPSTMLELLELSGVSRKTANVVLSNSFNINEGVVVDTHVMRLSQRLGFTLNTNRDKIEQDLKKICDQEDWGLLSHLLIDHGRAVCKARVPQCSKCQLVDICKTGKKNISKANA